MQQVLTASCEQGLAEAVAELLQAGLTPGLPRTIACVRGGYRDDAREQQEGARKSVLAAALPELSSYQAAAYGPVQGGRCWLWCADAVRAVLPVWLGLLGAEPSAVCVGCSQLLWFRAPVLTACLLRAATAMLNTLSQHTSAG